MSDTSWSTVHSSQEQSFNKAKADEAASDILRNLSKVTELEMGKTMEHEFESLCLFALTVMPQGPYSATTKGVLGKSLNLSKLHFLFL